MAYYHDLLTSPTDGLQKIVVWLQSLGWTVNMSQAEGSGWRVHLAKNGLYVNIRAFHNELTPISNYYAGYGWGYQLNVSTGFDAGRAWHFQPGAPLTHYSSSIGMRAGCKLGGNSSTCGPLNGMYCFSDALDNVCIVFEGNPGIACYMGWGSLVKIGSWTGGTYFFGSRPATYSWTDSVGAGHYTVVGPAPFYNATYHSALVRIDVDNTLNYWLGVGVGSYTTTSQTSSDCTTKDACIYTPLDYKAGVIGEHLCPAEIPGYGGYGNSANSTTDFQNRLFNASNYQHLLAPIHCYVTRAEGGYSLIGRVPGIYLCKATENGMALGTELIRGTDRYVVFPEFAVKKVI